MKTRIHNLFLRLAFMGLLTMSASAQTFTLLHNFTSSTSDGQVPGGGLLIFGSTMYGTTETGGNSYGGAVYSINTNGTGLTILHNFNGSDGHNPYGNLILIGNVLYGVTYDGGTNGNGTIFSVSTNGSFNPLYSFSASQTNSSGSYTNSDGDHPNGGLLLVGNTLYGTASIGGINGSGTIFSISTNGTGFKTLYSFTAQTYLTNNDGNTPNGGLVLAGNSLYGTARSGGINDYGTVFAVNTNGTSFTNLYNFAGIFGVGDYPSAGLILSGRTLYGETTGINTPPGDGSVFAINIDGTGYTNLLFFSYSYNSYVNNVIVNSNGVFPQGGLIISGNTLYGTANWGGLNGNGTVFAVNIDGSGFIDLYDFSATTRSTGPVNKIYNYGGAFPTAGVVLSGSTLYGTAFGGGNSTYGTIFSLTLPPIIAPQMAIIPASANSNFVVAWPTNATGFTLESTTNLSSQVWNTNLPPPVVVNGQNTVTNAVSGDQQFFRLWHP